MDSFEPVGHCIYCGANDNLSDEHVIAFALGGNLILRDASCRRCAKITGRVEHRVLRHMLGPFRSRLNLPTRRPRERPDSLPLRIHGEDGMIETRQVPRAEFPGVCVGFRWPSPGILRGVGPSDAFERTEAVMKFVEGDLERHLPPDGRKVHLGAFNVNVFARMLAKIAHAYAVAQIGEAHFEPMLVDVILERSGSLPWLVGGDTSDRPLEHEAVLHRIEMLRCRSRGTDYHLVAIRLFAMADMPRYHVVVGRAAQ